MDTYIVRIYRQDKGNPAEPVGVLEEACSSTSQSFRGLGELCALLTACQQAKSGRSRDDCRAKAATGDQPKIYADEFPKCGQ